MAAWLLYATGVGLAFSGAAVLAEAGLRVGGHPAGRRRARWIWAAAMVATAGVPVGGGLAGWAGGSAASGSSSGGAADVLFLVVWAAVTLALLANMRLSAWTVERNVRSWTRGRRAGREVLVSDGFGPGVIGTRSPRIVLPAWASGAEPELEGLIVAHEVEHVRAGDTRLLLAAVVGAALLPWCLPLWFQLHRLRGAIETDCDARVLARTGDPRRYAEALVAVAGRRTRSLLPIPALAPGRGELERRIRHITAPPDAVSRPWAFLPAASLLLAAVLLAGTPLLVRAPDLPRPRFEARTARPGLAEPPRSATVILSIEPEAVSAPVD